MYLLCVSLIVLVSVLMCLIVLIQNSKGGGLAAGFASSNQIMGVRKTTDFLEKATWTLAGLMVIISVLAAYSLTSGEAVDSFDTQAVQTYETAADNAELPVEE